MAIIRDRDEIVDGVVQLRFVDTEENVRDIGAHDLSEVLEGLVLFTAELAKSGEFGDGPPPRVRVRVPKEGSFVLEAVLWLNENPMVATGLALTGVAGTAAVKEIGTGAGKAIVTAIGVGLRKLRGEQPTDFTYLESGDVKVKWPDNSVSEVRRETWEKLQGMKRPTRRALGKLLAPLNNDADKLEIRDASLDESTDEILTTEPEATAHRGDYLTAITDPDESYERERIFESEARLGSIDFDTTQKWRVETTKEGTRQAKIEDRDFLLRLDRGEALHKNDIFWVKIREVVSKERGHNARTDWAVLEVTRTKRGDVDGNSEISEAPPR